MVIVGGGFGGIAAARALRRTEVNAVLIDRQNHHLFQPLLYQVATAALSPADIAWPIRRILRRQRNVRVLMSEVSGLDVTRRQVLMGDRSLGYDYLVLACGATHSYFGNDDWQPHAPGLKRLADATAIRRRILIAFERAELEDDAQKRQRYLTFVVVGGGPTGVEMAGAIAELARKTMRSEFRRIESHSARVCLVEAGETVLSGFPESLRNYAARALDRLGVDVLLNSPVTHCDGRGVRLDDTLIDAATTIWAAGVAAAPVAGWLGGDTDRNGRVAVSPLLEAGESTNVFAIGDMAASIDRHGNPLPGVAAVAKQQGTYVGKLIARRVEGRPSAAPFRYRDSGTLATIGRREALANLRWIRLRGRLAWWFWGLVHIYFLINSRSRLTVAIQWLWSYLTFDRSARLIIDDGDGQ